MGIFISNGGMGSQVGGVSAPIPTAGLLLYLNPNENVKTISGGVVNWFDTVSGAKTASMDIDTARRPTVSGGLVVFDGSNDCLIVSGPDLAAARLHIFIAAKTTVTNKAHIFLRKSANVSTPAASQLEWVFGPRSVSGSSQTDRKMEFRVTDNSGNHSLFTGDTTPHDTLFLAEVELGASGSFVYRENGVSKGTATLIEIPDGKDAQNPLIIGGFGTVADAGNRWLAGSVGLIAVYAEPQVKAVVNSVYQHFRDVHGLSITDRP
jgi:hypothetical protein